MAEDLYWHKKWVPDHYQYNFDLSKGPVSVEFFRGGKTNMWVLRFSHPKTPLVAIPACRRLPFHVNLISFATLPQALSAPHNGHDA